MKSWTVQINERDKGRRARERQARIRDRNARVANRRHMVEHPIRHAYSWARDRA